jgi:hypothetical protein
LDGTETPAHAPEFTADRSGCHSVTPRSDEQRLDPSDDSGARALEAVLHRWRMRHDARELEDDLARAGALARRERIERTTL